MKRKQLRLSRQTLRRLSPEALTDVAGGTTYTTITRTMETLQCPSSFFPRCPSDYAV